MRFSCVYNQIIIRIDFMYVTMRKWGNFMSRMRWRKLAVVETGCWLQVDQLSLLPRQQSSNFVTALDKLFASLVNAIPRPTTTKRPIIGVIHIRPQPSFLG